MLYTTIIILVLATTITWIDRHQRNKKFKKSGVMRDYERQRRKMVKM